jgi:hypothetical protein
MKKIFLLLFVGILAFSSCENVEDNSTVIQAEIDSVFFKSFDAIGTRLEDGSITMQGITDNEVLTLHLSGFQLGSYTLGGGSESYATFEDSNGNIYTTSPNGEGIINLTDRCISCGWLSGDFRFSAILNGLDTTYVSKGVFFDVSFGTGDDDSPNAGSFSAQIDGTPFTPISVSAVDSGNSLIISGAETIKSIIIRVPVNVEVGNYALPQSGFQASLAEGAVNQNATEGNISVITHNVAARTISGSFSFITSQNTVSEGQFNVTY